MHYYRDKDTNEIDMVVEADGELHPLEIKKSTNWIYRCGGAASPT